MYTPLPRSEILSRVRSVEIRSGALGRWHWAMGSAPARHTKARISEDAVGIVEVEGGVVCAVADGLGSTRGAAQASERAVEAVLASVGDAATRELQMAAIIDAFQLASKRIRGLRSGAASTLVVALAGAHEVQFFWAGDSLGALLSSRKIVACTAPEHVAGVAMRIGAKGFENQSNVLINYLGEVEFQIAVSARYPLKRGRAIVLASDGAYEGQVERLPRAARIDPAAACSELVRLATPDARHDDATAIVLHWR